MPRLQSTAAILRRSPRTAATGASARAADSWPRNAVGGYRPTPRGNLRA